MDYKRRGTPQPLAARVCTATSHTVHLFLNLSFTSKLYSRFSIDVVCKYAVVNGSLSLEQCVSNSLRAT